MCKERQRKLQNCHPGSVGIDAILSALQNGILGLSNHKNEPSLMHQPWCISSPSLLNDPKDFQEKPDMMSMRLTLFFC